RIKRPPSARFSTGETNFWLPFFRATNAFLGTLTRGYRRWFCVSAMDHPYHYDMPFTVTTAPRVPTSHRPCVQVQRPRRADFFFPFRSRERVGPCSEESVFDL